MGTKNNPGEFDCYDKADPDEPIFTLRAKDATAPFIVEEWIHTREREAALYGIMIDDTYRAKLDEAQRCAHDMRAWRLEHVGG